MDCLRSLQADDLPHRMWNPTTTCVFKTLTGQFTVLQFYGTLSYPIPSIHIAMDLIYSSSSICLLSAISKDNDAFGLSSYCSNAKSKNFFKANKTLFVYRWFWTNVHTWKKIDVRRYSDRHRSYFTSDWDKIGFEIFTFINLSPDLSPLSLSHQCRLRLKKIEPRSKSREKRDKKLTQVAPVAQKRQKVLAEAKKTDHDICRILHWVTIYHFPYFP